MREEYDFSNGIKNPYATKLKKTIPEPANAHIDDDILEVFKKNNEDWQLKLNNFLRVAVKTFSFNPIETAQMC